MEITFLGTSAMVPTKERNHACVLLTYKGEHILFDCGENVQRQLRIAGFSPSKIKKVLISHWHGDHSLGVPGLIQMLGACNYSDELLIFGPKSSKLFIQRMISAFLLEDKIRYTVREVNGRFFENDDYRLEAFSLKHTAPCLAFSFIEKDKLRINMSYMKKFNLIKHPLLGELQKGKDIVYKGKKIKAKDATVLKKGIKITYITDTLPIENCVKAARDAHLLICEATFSNELKDKAREYQHLTAEDAATIARKARVRRLILTHFSQRYKNTKILEKEAKAVFKNTICANDFMKITL